MRGPTLLGWEGVTGRGAGAQGREKINLIETFNKLGYHILVSDVDTVWCAPSLPPAPSWFCVNVWHVIRSLAAA